MSPTIAVKIDEAAHNDHGPLNGFLAALEEIPEQAWGPHREPDDMEAAMAPRVLRHGLRARSNRRAAGGGSFIYTMYAA